MSKSLPSTAAAQLFVAPQSDFKSAEISLEPTGDTTLVKVLLCTICGSDLHTFQGHRAGPMPSLLGHEIIGEIVSLPAAGRLDADGQSLQRGDRVTWTLCSSCGDCFYCHQQVPQKCQTVFKYGHEPFESAPLSGGLSEYCVIESGSDIFKLPANLPLEVACPANCATSTVMAALDASPPVAKQTVLITGAGLLGLTTASVCREAGAQVILSDPEPSRLESAKDFGADITTTPANLERTVNDCSDGRGVDVALEMSGALSAVEACVANLRIGGHATLVGTVSPTPPIQLDPETMVRRLLSIRGVHNYSGKHLRSAIQFLATCHDRYPLAKVVERVFSLNESNAAFRYAIENKPLRVGIRADS